MASQQSLPEEEALDVSVEASLPREEFDVTLPVLVQSKREAMARGALGRPGGAEKHVDISLRSCLVWPLVCVPGTRQAKRS